MPLLPVLSYCSLKNGPLFVYVFVSEALNGRSTPLSLAYVGLIFVPIWLFVVMYGIRLRRLKILWCYPIILLMLPIMSACFQFYGMMTLSVRTWGGPRADADADKTKEKAPADEPKPRVPNTDKEKDDRVVEIEDAPELQQKPGYSPRKAERQRAELSPRRQRAQAMQMPVRAVPA